VQLLRPAPAGHPPPDPPGGTVLGLARRGQALLERQLHLVDELGRDEPAPGRRQGLVLLDHLTTRLRRNAETLLAVAGPGPVGRWDRAVPVATLLRAAVAELHEFPEVELVAVDEAEVAGPAAADLVHLLAELLDNAVAFSPPAEPVALTGAGDADGYLIQIADRGLGMTDAELAWANRRLAGGPDGAGPDPDGRPGDRLGLALAGRLAARHGLGVQLGRSPASGVAAAVRLPASLLSARTPTPVEHA
jgi:signal transduction histidine kinase